MGTILLPAVIVAVIGLVAGIILTIASKLMYVPVDERVAAIREALPEQTAAPVVLRAVMIMPTLWEKTLK